MLCASIGFSAEDENENLIVNPSFEAAGKTGDLTAGWDSGIYKSGKRIAGKAGEGKFYYQLRGDGKNHFAIRQSISGKRLPASGKLAVSCYVKVDSCRQGVIKPIHFIVISNGKASYPPGLPGIGRNDNGKSI